PSCASLVRPPPTSTLFPYTTLFRSLQHANPLAAMKQAIKLIDDPNAASRERRQCCAGHSQTRERRIARFRFPTVKSWCEPWSDSDRKSTRLNSSHVSISYAVFCLKK